MPVFALAQYARPELVPYLLPFSLYLAIAAGTIAHNHNHCVTFESKTLNTIFSNYISVFYGYPVFAWIPTHNLNHHKLVNKPGDATITWRHTNSNNALVALTYFFVSAYYQAGPINEYKKKAREKNPKLARQITMQYAVWLGVSAAFLVLGVALHGWKTGLWLFALVTFLPQFLGTYTMMLFNYMQHVHCDPWSKVNHSRNITGRIFNFLLFNNGLHTVHHNNAGAHWSTAYVEHAKVAHLVDPRLNEASYCWFVLRVYFLGPFYVPFRTQQLGRAPFDPPAGKKLSLDTDSVEAFEVGTNAAIT